MTIDDPFADPPDSDPTIVIAPTPGGRRPAPAAPPPSAETPTVAPAAGQPSGPSAARPPELQSLANAKLNPLVNAALPLLDLCVQLKNRAVHTHVEALRDRVVAEITTFERRITPLGISPQTIRAARYSLCATIDDIILNTPWGSQSVWGTRSMVGTFHNEVLGGDRFWELLNQLKRDAAVNLDLLELLYLCVSLGFEGKYRVMPRGASELIVVREDLYRVIRNNRGDFERALSPHWQGVKISHGLRNILPNWLVAVFAVGVIGILYAVFTFAQTVLTEEARTNVERLPPTDPPSIAGARLGPVAPPPNIQQFLQPQVQAGEVTFPAAAPGEVKIRVTVPTMFASGGVVPGRQDVLNAIADALNKVPGRVQVIGHTDNQRPGLKFHFDNVELSQERANAVNDVLKARLSDASRLRTPKGYGAADPVAGATNDTAEGRAQNRRVEIILSAER